MRRGFSEVYIHLFHTAFTTVKDIYEKEEAKHKDMRKQLSDFEQIENSLHMEHVIAHKDIMGRKSDQQTPYVKNAEEQMSIITRMKELRIKLEVNEKHLDFIRTTLLLIVFLQKELNDYCEKSINGQIHDINLALAKSNRLTASDFVVGLMAP